MFLFFCHPRPVNGYLGKKSITSAEEYRAGRPATASEAERVAAGRGLNFVVAKKEVSP